MPNTPSSFGEPVGLHGNAAARWLAPTIGFGDDVVAPAANGAAADSIAPTTPQSPRRRDPVRWKEVNWVGFPEGAAPPPVPAARTPRSVPVAVERASPPVVVAPVTIPPRAPASARPIQAVIVETVPPVVEAMPAATVEATRPPPSRRPRRSLLRRPVLRAPFDLSRLRFDALPQLSAAVQGRQLRLAALTVAVAAVVVAGYFGGERLAGFAGAAPSLRAVMASPSPSGLAGLPHPPSSPVAGVSAHVAAFEGTGTAPANRYLQLAKSGEPAAEYDLGVLYARGDGVAQDLGSAAAWFRKAAQGGVLPAAFNLGVMYERGLGVDRDMDQAVAWYRRAAARNYPPAQYNLAIAYAEGRGTPQDMIAAAHWYHDAAMQGLAAAMVNIAILYEQGEGVARSLPDAYAWYRAAARRGNTTAAQRARTLFDQLNVADKARSLLQASATADALHEAPGEPLPAASAGADDYDPQSNLSPGGWLSGAPAVPATHQLPSG